MGVFWVVILCCVLALLILRLSIAVDRQREDAKRLLQLEAQMIEVQAALEKAQILLGRPQTARRPI